MRPGIVFWGVFFISLGTFILIGKFDSMLFDNTIVFDLWPLLFVFFGISLLKVKNIVKYISLAAAAILLSLYITTSFFNANRFFDHFNFNFNSNNWDDKNITSSVSALDYDSTYDTANLRIEGGFGTYKISDTTDKLIELKSKGYGLNPTMNNDPGTKTISLTSASNVEIHPGRKNNPKVMALLALNTKPVWNLNFEVGAMKFDCDLRKFKSRNIAFNAGAAKIDINVGDLSDTVNLKFDVGASSVEILVPITSGCEITSDAGLSGTNFRGFQNLGNDLYRTENFYSAPKKVFINISGGISSFSVKRI